LLDDGIIDPRQTREVLSLLLATVREAAARTPHALQFAVPRF
jgi:geranyl-CoA carboxylase beta subunit